MFSILQLFFLKVHVRWKSLLCLLLFWLLFLAQPQHNNVTITVICELLDLNQSKAIHQTWTHLFSMKKELWRTAYEADALLNICIVNVKWFITCRSNSVQYACPKTISFLFFEPWREIYRYNDGYLMYYWW